MRSGPPNAPDDLELLKAVRSASGQIPFILFTGKGRHHYAVPFFDALRGTLTDLVARTDP